MEWGDWGLSATSYTIVNTIILLYTIEPRKTFPGTATWYWSTRILAFQFVIYNLESVEESLWSFPTADYRT